jgi:GxxExxY protein
MTRPPSYKGYDFEPLSYAVIGACIDVQSQLGLHCKEEDYQRALTLALNKRGLHFEREFAIPVLFDGEEVAHRRLDFRIWDEIAELLLETKARDSLASKDIEQSLSYLQQANFSLCLLVNFGEKPLGIRRFVNTFDREDRA